MTNTYLTGNAIGSTSPKDLYDNSSNFDEAINSSGPSWTDRLGLRRETWTGMQTQVSDYMAAMGFEAAHLTYIDGSTLTVLRPTQLIDRAGSVYKVKQPANFPVTLSGTWSSDALLLSDVSDVALRTTLSEPDGSSYVGFIQSGTGAVARTSLSKMRDVVSILDFGGVGDGVTDNYSAMQAAHTAHAVVYYPAGDYRCVGQVTVTGKFGLLGDGANITNISFSGGTQGFSVVQTNATDGFNVSHATFKTDDSTGAFTGIKIDGSPQMGPVFDGFRYILANRNFFRGSISNVVFSGSSNSAGWGIGLHMKSVMNFSIDTFTYTGLVPAIVGNLSGVAILINGDGAPTDIRLRGIWVFYALYAVLMPDYTEGVHIDNYEFVVVAYGIMGRYTPGYSILPEASCGCLAIYSDQGHINALQGGIIVSNSNANFFSRLNIYLQPRSADNAARAIQISGGNDHRLRDIFVLGDAAQNTKTNNYGVLLIGVGLSFVDSVTASSLLSAVHLQGSSNNEIMNIQSRASLGVVTGDAVATGNNIGPGRAFSNSGPKYPVALDNLIRMDEYTAVKTQTLGAGSSATLTVALPIGSFSQAPTFATIVFSDSSINYEWIYLRSSSSASSVEFLIMPAYPATVVPAGTVEFCVNVKGI